MATNTFFRRLLYKLIIPFLIIIAFFMFMFRVIVFFDQFTRPVVFIIFMTVLATIISFYFIFNDP